MNGKSRVRGLVFAAALAACAAAPAFGQASAQTPGQLKCALTMAQAPAVRGVRLGMKAEEVRALFADGTERPEVWGKLAVAANPPNFGVAQIYLQPGFHESPVKEKFAGVESFLLTVFDGRVAEMTVRYSGPQSIPKGPRWESVGDFVAKFAEAYRLPDEREWERTSARERTLRCAGYQMTASIQDGVGQVSIFNRAYAEKVKERADAEEERLRREFKP